jgi:hypothetical protein
VYCLRVCSVLICHVSCCLTHTGYVCPMPQRPKLTCIPCLLQLVRRSCAARVRYRMFARLPSAGPMKIIAEPEKRRSQRRGRCHSSTNVEAAISAATAATIATKYHSSSKHNIPPSHNQKRLQPTSNDIGCEGSQFRLKKADT